MVNAAALQPGDSVSFRRGDVFSGGLVVSRSGTSRLKITLNAYGSGDLPMVTGGLTGTCVRLDGDFIAVDGLQAESCGYAGFSVYGDHGSVPDGDEEQRRRLSIKVSDGSGSGVRTNGDDQPLRTAPGVGVRRLGRAVHDDAFERFARILFEEYGAKASTGSRSTEQNMMILHGDDFGTTAARSRFPSGSCNSRSTTCSGGGQGHRPLPRDTAGGKIGPRRTLSPSTRPPAPRDIGARRRRDATGTCSTSSGPCGASCSQAMGLIARGGTSSFGPTNGTTFEHNTVWLDGPDSQAVVCHASCPASTVIRANILVAVRNSPWMDSAGWTRSRTS